MLSRCQWQILVESRSRSQVVRKCSIINPHPPNNRTKILRSFDNNNNATVVLYSKTFLLYPSSFSGLAAHH
jgi:hypothetical protein